MKNLFILFIISSSFIFFLFSCGQIKKGSSTENLLDKANKNIMTAESLNNLKQKSELLKIAETDLNQANAATEKGPGITDKIASGYAYYYYVSGDFNEAKKYADRVKDKNNAFISVLNARIELKEKGRESAKSNISILEKVLSKSPRLAMAYLTLGDSHFILGNFQDAQKYYTEVLKIGETFQIQAADRLELLDEIRSIGIDTKKVQNIIFSNAVRRDEIANLLESVYDADKHLKFVKPPEGIFKDISESLYSDSISKLRGKGFFTYIQGENFEPFKPVTRGEMAKIVEDFLALKSGNTALRTRYLKDAKSSIKGIDIKDPYYNAIKTAVESKTMDISLDGSINPLEAISGLESLNILSKLIK